MKNILETVRGKSPRILVPMILTLVWTLLEFLSLFAGGVVAFNFYWLLATFTRLGMVALNLWFIKSFFLDGNQELYASFRKYVGYAVVLAYGAANLPIMAWQSDGLLDDSAAFFLWLIAALQAALMMALWISLRLKKSQVFYGYISAAEAKDKKLLHQRLKESKRGPLAVVLENGDMFIQTVFIVILLQQFIFQLYVIPTESMVPTMLKDDRPFVIKTLDGPTIPLSGVKLPEMIDIKRGQIVVFESPAYQDPPLYIKVVQQFVFYLTLSLVNLDKDEYGKEKVHYVVKRVTGEPGEKLMMVNDVLYVKTAADADFRPQEQDAAFRHVDLYKEEASVVSRIKEIKVNDGDRAVLDRWDERTKQVDADAQNQKLARLAADLDQAMSAIPAANLAAIDAMVQGLTEKSAADVYAAAEMVVKGLNFSVFQNPANLAQAPSMAILHQLALNPAIRATLRDFLLSTQSIDRQKLAGLNLFDQHSHAINLLYKETVGTRLLAMARLARVNAPVESYSTDKEMANNNLVVSELSRYLDHWDERNFPEFPAGADQYIPPGKFFLMGDNRYNSLDFRFDANSLGHTQKMDGLDQQSLVYFSGIAPRLLDRSRIIGHVAFRLFPFDRFGLIKP